VRIKDADGNMCTTQDQMAAAIADHFTGIFGQPGSGAFTLDYERLGVTLANLAELHLPFSEDEVRGHVRATF
jgi:hypothetical protein